MSGREVFEQYEQKSKLAQKAKDSPFMIFGKIEQNS